MYPYLVLISKHVMGQRHTTQFDFYTDANSKDNARIIAREKYPSVYILYNKGKKDQAWIGFFTGEIYSLYE